MRTIKVSFTKIKISIILTCYFLPRTWHSLSKDGMTILRCLIFKTPVSNQMMCLTEENKR